MSNTGRQWLGVDLDGTLAFEEPIWDGYAIGKPIPLMVERVRRWLIEGKSVRIVTARVASTNPDREEQRRLIIDWCVQQFGCVLPVTAEKDHLMAELWDDRAITVVRNMGVTIADFYTETA